MYGESATYTIGYSHVNEKNSRYRALPRSDNRLLVRNRSSVRSSLDKNRRNFVEEWGAAFYDLRRTKGANCEYKKVSNMLRDVIVRLAISGVGVVVGVLGFFVLFVGYGNPDVGFWSVLAS